VNIVAFIIAFALFLGGMALFAFAFYIEGFELLSFFAGILGLHRHPGARPQAHRRLIRTRPTRPTAAPRA
jgi:hypothetical protein